MEFQAAGRRYETLRSSDVERDGMWLELWDLTDGPGELVLAAFWSDATGGLSFHAFKTEVTFEVVEIFVKEVRPALTPVVS